MAIADASTRVFPLTVDTYANSQNRANTHYQDQAIDLLVGWNANPETVAEPGQANSAITIEDLVPQTPSS